MVGLIGLLFIVLWWFECIVGLLCGLIVTLCLFGFVGLVGVYGIVYLLGVCVFVFACMSLCGL